MSDGRGKTRGTTEHNRNGKWSRIDSQRRRDLERDRRFVPSKRALCWFRETEEIALLHEPMNRFWRALNQQRVAKSQLDVLKMFPQVLALAMHCQDEHAITLLEIELMQRLAQKS